MNPNAPQPPHDDPPGDPEVRLTALLLGELPESEAAALQEAMAKDPALAELYKRLEKTIGLVREAVGATEVTAAPADAPLKLAEERREKLLGSFKVIPSQRLEQARRWKVSWRECASVAALFVALCLLVGAVFFFQDQRLGQFSSMDGLRDAELPEGEAKALAFKLRAGANNLRKYKVSAGESVTPAPTSPSKSESAAPAADAYHGYLLSAPSDSSTVPSPAPLALNSFVDTAGDAAGVAGRALESRGRLAGTVPLAPPPADPATGLPALTPAARPLATAPQAVAGSEALDRSTALSRRTVKPSSSPQTKIVLPVLVEPIQDETLQVQVANGSTTIQTDRFYTAPAESAGARFGNEANLSLTRSDISGPGKPAGQPAEPRPSLVAPGAAPTAGGQAAGGQGQLAGHDQTVESFTFSPDGTRLLGRSTDSTVQLGGAQVGAKPGQPVPAREADFDRSSGGLAITGAGRDNAAKDPAQVAAGTYSRLHTDLSKQQAQSPAAPINPAFIGDPIRAGVLLQPQGQEPQQHVDLNWNAAGRNAQDFSDQALFITNTVDLYAFGAGVNAPQAQSHFLSGVDGRGLGLLEGAQDKERLEQLADLTKRNGTSPGQMALGTDAKGVTVLKEAREPNNPLETRLKAAQDDLRGWTNAGVKTTDIPVALGDGTAQTKSDSGSTKTRDELARAGKPMPGEPVTVTEGKPAEGEDLKVFRSRLRVDTRRTDLNQQELAQELQTQRLAQSVEKAELTRQSNEFVNLKAAFEDKVSQLSDGELDQVRAKYETTLASSQQREQLIAEYEKLVKDTGASEGRTNRFDERLRALVNRAASGPEETKAPLQVAKLPESKKRELKEETELELKRAQPPAPAPIPQPEVLTREQPFSTFSLNVSDVSFKLAAAALEKRTMPDPSTVRSEEFINAFDYRDPEPRAGAPVAFAWERARYPFAHNRDLLRFSIKTAASGRQAGRPLNLVLLLDNSGSMERADRVAIISECLRVLATQLRPEDRVSVVAFARTPRLWIDGLPGSQASELVPRVGGLTPQGGTNLEDAMNLAYQTALRHYSPTGMNRVVLLTDGAANLGEVKPDSLKRKVETHRKQGVALDCFGIGWEGYNDDLLETLSRNGDGRYGFVNSPEAAGTEFAGQLAGALQVAASDVKVQVQFNPQRVTMHRQIGYAKHQLTKQQFRDNTVDAAEISAAEAGNALYVAQIQPQGEGPIATVRVRYKVPGTTSYHEHEWVVPFNGAAQALEQSTTTLRLAGAASAFSEWLVSSPFAAEVAPDRLLGLLGGVSETYAADPRPKKLEWMIRQAKAIAGR